MIRGLGFYACDPRGGSGCSLSISKEEWDKVKKNELQLETVIKEKICPACYLFGCTGWSSKFSIRVLQAESNEPVEDLESPNFSFRLIFLERKAIEPAEKSLLQRTLQLIADYGALGGKTAFKPSEINAKNGKFHHQDFGLITFDSKQQAVTIDQRYFNDESGGTAFVIKDNDKEWPDLRNFWFVKGKHLDRQQINSLVNRNTSPTNGNYINISQDNLFLGGFISREKGGLYREINSASKKIFSFHGSGNRNLERCFGYLRIGDDLDGFIEKIADILKIDISNATKGTDILNK